MPGSVPIKMRRNCCISVPDTLSALICSPYLLPVGVSPWRRPFEEIDRQAGSTEEEIERLADAWAEYLEER